MVTLVGGALLIIPSVLVGEFNLQPSFSDIDLDLAISYTFLIFIGTVVPFAEFYLLLKVSPPPVANLCLYSTNCSSVFGMGYS